MCRARATLCVAGAGSDLLPTLPRALMLQHKELVAEQTGARCCRTEAALLLEPGGSGKPPRAAAFQARPPAKLRLALHTLPC